eukprot:3612120-Prymnesium_polylepis.1
MRSGGACEELKKQRAERGSCGAWSSAARAREWAYPRLAIPAIRVAEGIATCGPGAQRCACSDVNPFLDGRHTRAGT